jgi:hypothetical protein
MRTIERWGARGRLADRIAVMDVWIFHECPLQEMIFEKR